MGAADDALEKTFDASTAKAVRFYIDTNILVRNPDAYADSVLRMFGKLGGELVISAITKNLTERAGIGDPGQKWTSLRECVRAVERRYHPR